MSEARGQVAITEQVAEVRHEVKVQELMSQLGQREQTLVGEIEAEANRRFSLAEQRISVQNSNLTAEVRSAAAAQEILMKKGQELEAAFAEIRAESQGYRTELHSVGGTLSAAHALEAKCNMLENEVSRARTEIQSVSNTMSVAHVLENQCEQRTQELAASTAEQTVYLKELTRTRALLQEAQSLGSMAVEERNEEMDKCQWSEQVIRALQMP